jgi:hypothetical protein
VERETVNDKKSQAFDYKTHILIACTSEGKMSVVCHWPHLPREVDREIDVSKEGHTTFLLCTPTSILPILANGQPKRLSPARLK